MHGSRALLVACIALFPLAAGAQLQPAPAGIVMRSRPTPEADTGAVRRKIRIGPIAIPRRDSSWWVPFASAAMPGTGQALLGQDRFIAYLAVEGFALLGYLDQRAEQNRQRDRFQSLASNVARALYPGDHPAGNWAYYELLEHWKESGVFNLVPGGTFTPESDPLTYNGASWLLARQTYWTDPNVQPDPTSAEYRSAIAFYTARAVQPQFRWSWTNAAFEKDVYVQTVERANQAARDARTQMGILIGNHLLSMVDAYVTLRVHGGLGAPTTFSATIPWAPFGRGSQPR
jgi:hypothetical protein